MVHGIREVQYRRAKSRSGPLWPWNRMTGWRAVHTVMEAAGLDGPHASPKGLRHGFGVAAVCAGIPLNLVQKWLGHAQLSTTAIYADAAMQFGAEEKDIARRMWRLRAGCLLKAKQARSDRRQSGFTGVFRLRTGLGLGLSGSAGSLVRISKPKLAASASPQAESSSSAGSSGGGAFVVALPMVAAPC